jgi:hypothetical protein
MARALGRLLVGGAFVLVGLSLTSCGDSAPTSPGPLPTQPELVSPKNGETVPTDTPVFTVLNGRGFDEGQADYTFRVSIASTDRDVASMTVHAGRGQTSTRFPKPLLRGATLAWQVTARKTSGEEVVSTSSTFRVPSVTCVATSGRFAKKVVDWWVSTCSLLTNLYNDPNAVLGPPDAQEIAPGAYRGMISLGDGGYVAVDTEACAVDGPGDDVRVYQTVSTEPVTLYASSDPAGPWVLLEYRKPCGSRVPGVFSRGCTFDLARAGLEEARYFKIEDGELYPCPGEGGTNGADIDALELLNVKP